MRSYYDKKIMIAKCDKNGNVLGPIERWEAHKKGILHRAFSVTLKYKNSYLVQLRKHPVFDGVLDVTSSSHQVFNTKTNTLQDTIEASISTLIREWKVTEDDFTDRPKIIGSVYYKSKDKHSIYIEHEVDDIVEVKIKRIPTPNLEYAYGAALMTRENLLETKRINSILAPWVIEMLDKNLL